MDKNKLQNFNNSFTMAEILISLTIIGIIAAITLPALQANINEKTWATRRKALYSRLSQAISMMPSLNGYGIGVDDNETAEKATEAFITNGLGKVLELNNICAYNKMADCGIVSKYTRRGNIVVHSNFPTDMTSLNRYITNTTDNGLQHIVNTKAGAFITKNGESVAVFYNPYCIPRDIMAHSNFSGYSDRLEHRIQNYLCANFIYDLNGRKGPNRIGDDMGVITAMYSTEPDVLALELYKKKLSTGIGNYATGLRECRKHNGYRLPNIDELTAIWYNYAIFDTYTSGDYLSATNGRVEGITYKLTWVQNFSSYGYRWIASATNEFNSMRILCIRR